MKKLWEWIKSKFVRVEYIEIEPARRGKVVPPGAVMTIYTGDTTQEYVYVLNRSQDTYYISTNVHE